MFMGSLGLPYGNIILAVLAVLVYFGVLQRVLDRMRLNDRVALVVIVAIAAGSFIDVSLVSRPVEVSLNIGGALIPLAFSVWLVATAHQPSEKIRAVIAVLVAGGMVWGLGKVLSPDDQWMRISPMLIFGLTAGVVAGLAGRSRRAAFVGGLGAIIIADIIHLVELTVMKIPGSVAFGGAGAFDATIISGILAVGLVEIIGEVRERALKTAGGDEDSDEIS